MTTDTGSDTNNIVKIYPGPIIKAGIFLCPFCKTPDFDAPGLKEHLISCAEFLKLPPQWIDAVLTAKGEIC